MEEELIAIKDHYIPKWKLIITNTQRQLGCCSVSKFEIHVSNKYFHIPEITKQILLHEIAHALHYLRHLNRGHTRQFRDICKELGCINDRMAINSCKPLMNLIKESKNVKTGN